MSEEVELICYSGLIWHTRSNVCLKKWRIYISAAFTMKIMASISPLFTALAALRTLILDN